MLHLLFKVVIHIVFKNVHTYPNSNVILARLKVLNPKFFNSLRIYAPYSDRLFPPAQLFLILLILIFLHLLVRFWIIGLDLFFSYYFNEEETFLKISYLLSKSLDIFYIRESKSKLFSFAIGCPSIVLYCQIVAKIFFDLHDFFYQFLLEHQITF